MAGPCLGYYSQKPSSCGSLCFTSLVFTKTPFHVFSGIKCVFNSTSQQSEAMPFKVRMKFLEMNIQNSSLDHFFLK